VWWRPLLPWHYLLLLLLLVMRTARWLRLVRSLLLLLAWLLALLLLLLRWWHTSCRGHVAWPWLRPWCSSWRAMSWHVRQPNMLLLLLLLWWRHLLAPARNHVLLLPLWLLHPWRPRTRPC
jgi:hypothetical protein